MNRVFVLSTDKQPLSPCHPARARMLLRGGRAAVYRRYPFTIILKRETGCATQPMELKLDPGSKTTGVALVREGKCGKAVVWAGEIEHHGEAIRKALLQRRSYRRRRRCANLRYRAPRFKNRTRPKGWLSPSLRSRVDNVSVWTRRLRGLCPISSIAVETVRFDTQLIQNPEVSGVRYQQGELAGYELREYLLEKWKRRCAYCGTENVPLQIEHIVPRSKGGSNRTSNLTLACQDCNQAKGNRPVEEFLAGKPDALKRVLAKAKAPLRDAAAVNSTRYAIGNALKASGLPVSFWSGGRTKYNRSRQGYPKAHWIDAACVGKTGAAMRLNPGQIPLVITATGRGSRQMCKPDRFGFPRTSAKGARTVKGFRTGDIVKAVVPTGKKAGTHLGRVAVRSSGSFNITTATVTIQGISHKYCRRLYQADGYGYQNKSSILTALPPHV
jgi:5-methylcytosine-specific restriction endonuclease McrA